MRFEQGRGSVRVSRRDTGFEAMHRFLVAYTSAGEGTPARIAFAQNDTDQPGVVIMEVGTARVWMPVEMGAAAVEAIQNLAATCPIAAARAAFAQLAEHLRTVLVASGQMQVAKH